MFKKFITLLTVVLIVPLVLSSCGPADENGGADAISPKHGGILRTAYHAPVNLDPAFQGGRGDSLVAYQWNDALVYINEDNEPDIDRSVAKKWESNETGTIWTLELRQGIKFHDGKEMTSRDVKFSYDRLRDPEIGAPTVDMYSNIKDITTPNDYTVVFELIDSNPDFLKDLGDYHAKIMDANNTDFATNWNGTGPFIIESYIPEDRIVFKRNPNYWMTDKDGYQLPYLDGMEFIFLDDPSAQLEALRSGQVDFLVYLPPEFVPVLEEDPNIVIHSKASDATYVIRMRSDKPPADDVRVRQAFKAATDRSAILEGALGSSALGVAGRDTPIGPACGDFYLNVPEPKRDVEKAKQLLAEAGYPDGLDITLHAMTSDPVPAIATIWKEQLAEAGINVEIQLIPGDVYYSDLWLEVDFGITDWAPRPYPQHYLQLAYITGAPWNESHWFDPEIDELAVAAAKEMDHDTRVELYHRIQEIFIERGPIIVPFFHDNMWAAQAKIKGFLPTSSIGSAQDMRSVYLEQ